MLNSDLPWASLNFPDQTSCAHRTSLSGLPWKIALHQKPSSSSSAAITSWSILMGGFLELSYGLSFLVVTILASTFQFVSSKTLYQKRSEDFPGVRTIFKTYPNFLLNSIVTFPHHVHLLILLTRRDYAWMKWHLQTVRKLGQSLYPQGRLSWPRFADTFFLKKGKVKLCLPHCLNNVVRSCPNYF